MSKGHDKIEYVEDSSAEALKGAKAGDKIKKIKKRLKSCEKERGEYLAGWQRAKADLINYKKEMEQKNSDIFKFANENLILEILLVLDSFELALKHDTHGAGGGDGVKQLYNQLLQILKSNGLEEIQAIGEKFNPEFHESAGEIKKGKSGFVVEEVQKGYILNNKVIRPSKVKTSK